MYNYFISIEYDGTKFVGWQYQKNGISVQEVIERKLSRILKKKIKIIGAGRNDKGVHAKYQCANFLIEKKIDDEKKTLNSLNFFLKKNKISILEIRKKNLSFNARYNAKERIYEYIIVNRYGRLSLDSDKAWLIKKKMNLSLLKKGAKILQGKHDFSSFRASSCSAKSPIKRINKVLVKKHNDKILIKFYSQSFLHN